jgi:two-component sensor histidine kinase
LPLVESLATTAAIAIENARLYAQTRQDAVTKAMLLDEVNHRVKNNLTAIAGLLYAELRYADVKMGAREGRAAYASILQDLLDRIQGMKLVHNMLSASEWQPLPLEALTRRMMGGALRGLTREKRVHYTVNAVPVRLIPRQASSFALVISELVTNSIKHAFAAGQTDLQVVVDIAYDGDADDAEMCFTYRDDGRGYPDAVLRFETHSVGLHLVRTMVEHDLQGQIALSNADGAVAKICFHAL